MKDEPRPVDDVERLGETHPFVAELQRLSRLAAEPSAAEFGRIGLRSVVDALAAWQRPAGPSLDQLAQLLRETAP